MISLENLCMIIRQKTISTFQGKAKLDHREKNVTSVVEDIKAFTSQNIAEEFARAIIQFQKMNIIPLKMLQLLYLNLNVTNALSICLDKIFFVQDKIRLL